jgi:hypothetical protein
LEELLLYCRMPEVGIVGAKLLFRMHDSACGVITGFFNGLACLRLRMCYDGTRLYEFAVVPAIIPL